MSVEIICEMCGVRKMVKPARRKQKCCSIACREAFKTKHGINPHQIRDESKWLAALQSEENRARNSKLHLGAVRSTDKSRRFSADHIRSAEFYVCSPSHVYYHICNIAKFVHDNERLFPPAAVVWKLSGRYKSFTCHAAHGLSTLHTERRHSWRGWTLASVQEFEQLNKTKGTT